MKESRSYQAIRIIFERGVQFAHYLYTHKKVLTLLLTLIVSIEPLWMSVSQGHTDDAFAEYQMQSAKFDAYQLEMDIASGDLNLQAANLINCLRIYGSNNC